MPKINAAEAAGLTPAETDRIATSIERDLEVLRAFCRRVDRLERSGFSKRFETDILDSCCDLDGFLLHRSRASFAAAPMMILA